MFPPVLVGLNPPIREGRWQIVGNVPIKDFQFPQFRCTSSSGAGVFNNWYIWDGEQERFIGNLPEELRELEMRCVWSAAILEDRIMGGPWARTKYLAV